MRIPQKLPGVLYALTVCCSVGGGLWPLEAHAGGAGSADVAIADGASALHFQSGPCGLRSLRGQGGQGGGADLVGVWHCAQQVLMPARLHDTDSDSPAFTKNNGLKWGVRVRHDQVLVSVGFKW